MTVRSDSTQLRIFSGYLVASAATVMLTAAGLVSAAESDDWAKTVQKAKGETVYFNAWGGDRLSNTYIQWLADRVDTIYGINLEHVKLADTAEAVSRVLSEKQAGNTDKGAVDLIWINGENFASMKYSKLLYGPWAENVPNFTLTNPDENAAVRFDFTVAVEGFELPWGKAQLVFFYDTQLTSNPPGTMPELLEWSKTNKGSFTYVRPPQYLGTTFLKQALIELAADKAALYRPVAEADFEVVTAPLWKFLDELHPMLWRSGQAFADSGPALIRMMADGEISLAYSFNVQEAASAIASNDLPPSVKTYVLDGGTIGNFSFVAIPFNASHAKAATVVANYMLSPEAQAHKQDARVWGNSTVLAFGTLSAEQKAPFEALPSLPGSADPAGLAKVVAEPHASWVDALEAAWQKRYAGG